MSALTLKITCDNAAFHDEQTGAAEPWNELARLLRVVSDRLESGDDSGSVFDLNGNRVGNWSIE